MSVDVDTQAPAEAKQGWPLEAKQGWPGQPGLQGRHVPWQAGFPGSWAMPGDYCQVPPGVDPRKSRGVWYLMDPNGGCGAIVDQHNVTEHGDGSITVTPSLVMPSGWHGWLRKGTWVSV